MTNKPPRPLVLLGAQPRGLYECDYCGSDLTYTPRIRCAVCPDFDLCLECFVSEDTEHMAKYKREEEAQRRSEAAGSLAGAAQLFQTLPNYIVKCQTECWYDSTTPLHKSQVFHTCPRTRMVGHLK